MEVLSDINFSISTGDYVGIVGPNGSGKSTLVRTVLGLMSFDSGSVTLFDSPLGSFSQWERVGYLPQRIKLFNPNFPGTVEEIVKLGLLTEGGKLAFAPANKKELIDSALEMMGIAHLRKRLIGDLSGGQQQRVLLARAMVNRPKILILDEPTTALDPETREHFYSLVEGVNRKEGTTVILVTHDTWSIGKYANRFLYIDKKIIFDGSFDDFCKSDEMTAFFGEHAQHLICHRH
ncbi:MAG: metal ABC transporter ATP-binding protein [Geobacteraceae bacterium]|nr:metal ABC transporter ATP-binding protein [Geobacteraceae bacterium]